MADAKKAGRPPKDFDRETFEGLCKILATEEDICSIFKTTDKALSSWCRRTYGKNFAEIYKTLSANGKASVRRQLMKQVMAGNTSAIIYACKAILKLSDNPVDDEEKELKKRILRAQAKAAEAGSPDPLGGRQVIIINDTQQDAGAAPGADTDKPTDNT